MKKVLILFSLVLLFSGCTKTITLEEVLEKNNYVVLDVRTKEEYDSGHVVNAVNIPYNEIQDKINIEKEKDILVYCKSGTRSKIAYETLKNLGYHVYDLGAYDKVNLEKTNKESREEMQLYLKINKEVLTATLVNNSSTQKLVEELQEKDITIEMKDYANFEKVGKLAFDLPKNDEEFTTNYGDLILYQGNQFVIYYDTNHYTFTKLGHIENITQEKLKEILGKKNVTVTLSLSK